MSRLRSGRGANPGGKTGGKTGGTRAVAAQRGVYVQSPKPDIYVALLGVALGAMILGCLLMIMVLNRYGFQTKAVGRESARPFSIASALTIDNSGKSATVHL